MLQTEIWNLISPVSVATQTPQTSLIVSGKTGSLLRMCTQICVANGKSHQWRITHLFRGLLYLLQIVPFVVSTKLVNYSANNTSDAIPDDLLEIREDAEFINRRSSSASKPKQSSEFEGKYGSAQIRLKSEDYVSIPRNEFLEIPGKL